MSFPLAGKAKTDADRPVPEIRRSQSMTHEEVWTLRRGRLATVPPVHGQLRTCEEFSLAGIHIALVKRAEVALGK